MSKLIRVFGTVCLISSALFAQAGTKIAGEKVDTKPDPQVTVTVDCSTQSINDALSTSAFELIVEFSGDCFENVVITRRNLTVRGDGVSSVIVGTVSISNVIAPVAPVPDGPILLEDFSISGPGGSSGNTDTGLTVAANNVVTANGLSVSGFGLDGISVLAGAFLRCHHCSVTANGRVGLNVGANGTAEIGGDGTSAVNGFDGQFSGNGLESEVGAGIASGISGAVSLFSQDPAYPSAIIDASDNTDEGEGIVVFGGGSLFSGEHTILTVNNNRTGVLVHSGASAFLRGEINASGNGIALAALQGRMFVPATLMLINNTLSVFAAHDSSVDLSSIITNTMTVPPKGDDFVFNIFVESSYFAIGNTTFTGFPILMIFGSRVQLLGSDPFPPVLCLGTPGVSAGQGFRQGELNPIECMAPGLLPPPPS